MESRQAAYAAWAGSSATTPTTFTVEEPSRERNSEQLPLVLASVNSSPHHPGSQQSRYRYGRRAKSRKKLRTASIITRFREQQ